MLHSHFDFSKRVNTDRLLLAPMNLQILQVAIQGDGALSELLHVHVAEKWNEFGLQVLEYALQKLTREPEAEHWWTWLAILKEENILVGNGGYKGLPDQEGRIEIGYAIAPAYRKQGLATEMAQGLIQNAFEYPPVKLVTAHTLASPNASTKVLKRNHFQNVSELYEEGTGRIWRWELERPQ